MSDNVGTGFIPVRNNFFSFHCEALKVIPAKAGKQSHSHPRHCESRVYRGTKQSHLFKKKMRLPRFREIQFNNLPANTLKSVRIFVSQGARNDKRGYDTASKVKP